MADLRAHSNQRALVEILRIDHGAIYVREESAMRKSSPYEDNPYSDDALAYLFLGKGVDHFVFERIVTDRAVTV
jgi:hypothetical protein